MNLTEYLKIIQQRYDFGISTEHSYRGYLQTLLESLVSGIDVTNEPKRQKVGAPDYVIQNKQIPVGYIEAKDIGIDLDKIEKSEQIKRYLGSLDNIIITDYIEFQWFRNGIRVQTVKIAEIKSGKVKPIPENYSTFHTFIQNFCSFSGQTIKSSEKLATIMAQKARMMEEVIYKAVIDTDEENSIHDQFEAFRKVLIHDLDERKFSDIYAQTIAYGLFAARLHDESLDDFSREEAGTLIPKTNPFLRQLFKYVSDPDLDVRISWIINDLAEIFRATDLKEILKDFGRATQQNDAFIHFYETFLSEYDPKLRKSRGVYYTPEPVVKFIVRAVDDILKNDFNLSMGLADTTKIKMERETQVDDKRYKTGVRRETKEVHKVQILDPATGTGTFLSEVIKQIYSNFEGQQGIWSDYVEKDLIPRINGFEILIASYTMCHLKLEMLLKETGFTTKNNIKQQRLRVFLTNSLEEAHPDTGTLFASWLSNEATSANYIKKNTPVMVVLGNPPYSNFGQMNQGSWIRSLIEIYKKNLNEKKINLDDDYIKFIRYGQYYIDKNGEGILAYITNNSFLDGITHRNMRKSLLSSFEKIYIINLHGDSKKQEESPDGSPDNNVFDIRQGVSIHIFIKTKKCRNNSKADIFYYDLFGKRESKYIFLDKSKLSHIKWKKIDPFTPYYFFIPKDFSKQNKYQMGFSLTELFSKFSIGIETQKDSVTIQHSEEELFEVCKDIKILEPDDFQLKYNIKEGTDWRINNAKNDIIENFNPIKISYRPFDCRFTSYSGVTKGFHARPRNAVLRNMLIDNLALTSVKLNRKFEKETFFITDKITDKSITSSLDNATIFPLYIYSDNYSELGLDCGYRKSNLNLDIINTIKSKTGLEYSETNQEEQKYITPLSIIDYIYAILYSNYYRNLYREFLKIDHPRIPYPSTKEYYFTISKFGRQLRNIHLLKDNTISNFITAYPIGGQNKVTKITYEDNKVFINKEQYFDRVPKLAWSFFIGGYQPAQKWLKDRKGHQLTYDDIIHYQKIIVSLIETDRIMKEIDEVIEI